MSHNYFFLVELGGIGGATKIAINFVVGLPRTPTGLDSV